MNLRQLRTWIDDLAGGWADARFVAANTVLRTRITDLAADHKQLTRQFRRVVNANHSLATITRAYQAINGRVEAERDLARARVVELEEALAAASGQPGGPDDGWDGVVAAGLGMPSSKPQCAEGLIFNGDVENLIRCDLDGGHSGSHWNEERERGWPQLKLDTDCEVPW